MTDEEKHEPLTPLEKKLTRKELLRLGLIGGGAAVLAAAAIKLPDAYAASFSSRGVQFPSATSDGSNPGDYFFFVRSDESVAGRLRFWKSGVAYDVLNNIVNADIAAGAAIANSKIAGNANLGSSVFSGYPLVNQVDFFAAAGDYDYLITKVGSNFTSYDRAGNIFGTPGTDAGPVIRAVLTKLVVTDNVSGRVVFDPRYTYTINTTAADATAGTSAYRFSNTGALTLNYAIGIPNGAAPVSIELDGLVACDQIDDIGNTLITSGAIINLTTSIPGMTTLTGGNNIVGIWHLIPASGAGNKVTIKNLRVRFPNNQRTNISGVHMERALSNWYENVIADFATLPNSYAAPPAAGAGIPNIGIGTIQSQHHDPTGFRNHAIGWIYGHDFLSEHLISNGDTSYRCTYPFILGGWVTWPIYHDVSINGFSEGDCINGPVYGPGLLNDSPVYLTGYNLEFETTGTWQRLNGATETNIGGSTGEVQYNTVQAGVGEIFTEFWKAGGHGRYIYTHNDTVFILLPGSGTTNLLKSTFIVLVDATAGAATINLPPANEMAAYPITITIVKKDGSVNAVTVARNGADTIEGATTKVLSLQYGKIVLRSFGGSVWYDVTTGGI
jgi:hypothetical protein